MNDFFPTLVLIVQLIQNVHQDDKNVLMKPGEQNAPPSQFGMEMVNEIVQRV